MEFKTKTKKILIQVTDSTNFQISSLCHYACFCSQIDLTKNTIVMGEPGKSLNKKCVRFFDAAKMQPKCAFFFFKNTQKSRKVFPFAWKLHLLSRLVRLSYIKFERRSGIFIVNFEHISQLVLVFLLLTLNMQLRTGKDSNFCYQGS